MREKIVQGGVISCQSNEWDTISSHVDFSISIDIDRIKGVLPLNSKLLDYGCGYGRISRILKKAGYLNIIGYDTSFGMIERGQFENPDLDLRHSESYTLPEPSGSFDAVIIAGVLTSLPEQPLQISVLKEINRLLNHNGILVLSEFLRDDNRKYDANGCFLSKIGIRMKHFYDFEILSMLDEWGIVYFEKVDAESISRSIVPAVHVIAHSPHNHPVHRTAKNRRPVPGPL